MIYYHNPKCSKSREGLKIVEESAHNYKIKLYLSEKITFTELVQIIDKLKIKPIDLVRKKEKIIKEKDLDLSSMSDKEIIETLVENPILIERPILVTETKAIVGRPPELINTIL
ncbi:MAG: arsenate reductase (glutaredoxin) [Gammaproteobacteria bacterium]|jgi:arsenate reductase (glutaredoxin)|nr:arsenate reductase (glutaredoxin) [Gammaproteobacteria bacterium]MBT6754853.1 arsenate reductase (glutaredoxin) [Gammaproteobacteria bacterium]MBT7523369.1 arsenate reductase (glutaredoxin) [Gammaproteobacteria bacterium]MBT7814291.1 arsenate reductase (glutaredoxin) [Gammaproteobacteria bacterium]MDC3386048.1 arsenate reductase (glutaredoxin) [Gammaproteobacteria bacterium]